jgi:pentose-5-phosphate-3-epimerase
MSKMGTAYINRLNAEEDERLAAEKPSAHQRFIQSEHDKLKREEQLCGEHFTDFKVVKPDGGKDRKIVNPPIHCVQCGEVVGSLIFCSDECKANYHKEVTEWLDGIEDLLPSNRGKQ